MITEKNESKISKKRVYCKCECQADRTVMNFNFLNYKIVAINLMLLIGLTEKKWNIIKNYQK